MKFRNIPIYFFLAITLSAQELPLEIGIAKISDFIVLNNFEKMSDLEKVDEIYSYAISIYKNDYSEALLALTFACLPYKKMPLKIPLIGTRADIPLQVNMIEPFEKKVRKLPKRLVFDSPEGNFGDKDKLSHFFGNAYLTYSVRFLKLSKFLGAFVEIFEDSFNVTGGLDIRDIAFNTMGEFFGEALRENKKIKPSDSFLLYYFLFSYNY